MRKLDRITYLFAIALQTEEGNCAFNLQLLCTQSTSTIDALLVFVLFAILQVRFSGGARSLRSGQEHEDQEEEGHAEDLLVDAQNLPARLGRGDAEEAGTVLFHPRGKSTFLESL